ncbi:B-cell lymphoma 6 protein homolog isoform X1 [Archocentrus centrarchus]|uniref:B-cell lymphoma 6 protein homolog isoform X1 n=1 Tax=Archocentrus centrarchus TaxID=63155 RepID=UPI0011EA5255|nr:B-cell CLL/lymphoma 6 member B protein isoform X1 [Archocentrus centrarchus]
MSMMEVLEGYRVNRGQGMRAAAPAEGYVKEFTRHSNDVLLNLNELRHRSILTDTTLIVGSVHLQAHCAVLVACSGFFYSMYSRRALLQGRGGSGEQLMTVSLPTTLDPSSVSLLLDFMYTSRLPLTPSIVSGVLAVAVYLQMDHVADTCRDFMQLHCSENMSARHLQLELDSRVSVASVAPKGGDLPNPGPLRLLPTAAATRVPVVAGVSLKPGAFPSCQPRPKELKGEPESPLMGSPTLSPSSPARSSCQPSSPAASETCNKNLVSDAKATPDPKACNWKKYKYIVLNPLCAASAVKVEEMEEPQNRASPTVDLTPSTPTEAWSGEVPGQIDRQGQASCYEGSGRAPPLGPPPSVDHPTVSPSNKERQEAAGHSQHPVKRESYYMSYCYSGNLQGVKPACSGDKPYRCNVCGAQFNRPANLKTHSRIHSGEKPYRCDTCGARFVQVAHLRAHVLIHTGEKPYPCNTCGTRFRHLQTLKSHLRIHTGEKPYTCEKCDLHFRHKSQLRLHLRQKHGAVTNTKIRYKVLTEPYQPILQAC